MSLMLKFLNQQTKLNKTGANVEKQICGRGNRIYPDLVPNPIFSFWPLKGKFTKEKIFPLNFRASRQKLIKFPSSKVYLYSCEDRIPSILDLVIQMLGENLICEIFTGIALCRLESGSPTHLLLATLATSIHGSWGT